MAAPAPTSATKPVILFIHGAWHRPVHYTALTDLLKERFEVLTPSNLSAGPSNEPVGKSQLDDAAQCKALIQPYLDAGREVVIVAHSYGGIPATETAAGLAVTERCAQGLNGGVKAIVFVASLILAKKGMNVMDGLGVRGNLPPFWEVQGDLAVPTKLAPAAFYNGLVGKDEAQMERLGALIVNQSMASYETHAENGTADLQTKLVYVECEQDVCVPPFVQNILIEAIGTEKVQRVSVDSDHSPFLYEGPRAKIVEVICEVAEAEA